MRQSHVTKRIWSLLAQPSNTFVAFAAEPHRPVDRSAFAHFTFPFITDLGQVIRPDITCAAPVRAVHYYDLASRKIHSFVRASDERIIPLGDFSQENRSKSFGSEVQ